MVATIRCALCGVDKTRIWSGETKLRQSGRGWFPQKIQRDELGRKWVGRHCPPCANHRKAPGNRAEATLAEQMLCDPQPVRKCRLCPRNTAPYSYWYCAPHYTDHQAREEARDFSDEVRHYS